MMVKLPPQIPWLVIAVPLLAGPLLAQVADSLPSTAPQPKSAGLVVLRNGEILEGRVSDSGERVLVTLPGREISLRRSEIDVVAGTLDEAYALKVAKLRPTDVDGRLDLAIWCLRHDLLAGAAEELAAAARVQPFHTRVKAVERRLQQARAMRVPIQSSELRAAPVRPAPGDAAPPERSAPGTQSKKMAYSAAGRGWPPVAASEAPIVRIEGGNAGSTKPHPAGLAAGESPAALERFVRGLPAQAVERFTNSLQPMITHGCAAGGCHAAGNTNGFTLLRLPRGGTISRRLTQRNLYNTVQLVDFARPEESRLLKVASQPHGPLKAGVFGDPRSPKYQELLAWVSALTGTTIEREEPATERAASAVPWDRFERAFEQSPAAPEVGDVGLDADKVAPNQPAQIQSASRAPLKSKAQRSGQSADPRSTRTAAAKNSLKSAALR